MPKKNKNKDKNIFEDLEVVSAEANAQLTEEAKAGGEQDESLSVQQPENVEEMPSQTALDAEQAAPVAEDESPDDILEDVRRSLIEDEAHDHDKEEQPKWWRRIGKGSRKSAIAPEEPKAAEEVELPALEMLSIDQEFKREAEPQDEYQNQLDELIGLLHTEETGTETPAQAVEQTPAEPEKVLDIEELKRQAFQHRPTEDDAESLSEVRSIALEGGEEVFVEVESTTPDELEERVKAVENALKPYRRYINFAFAFLGLVMAVIAGALLFNVYKQTQPEPVAEVSSLPFPTSVSLPGGWAFNLGRGTLLDGNWNPRGAEWLDGTEVCRWVALPWSRQLEAVIRTLNADDPIQLGMSNNDKLIYKVYSIEQMSPEEMQKLDSNSPCLLIVLAEPGAEKRWVLTSLPE